MKTVIAATGFTFVVCGIASAADLPAVPVKAVVRSADNVWETTANIDFRYSSWRSTRGFPTLGAPLIGNGQGSQFYMPFGISTVGTPIENWKFELLARTGYVVSRQTTAGFGGDLATLTDTTLSGTATYTGIAGFVPFFSLNVNAPTGRAALYGNTRFARMDPDLVDVPTFGEGWNIGPTLGANIPITETLLATVSIGYTSRNPFNKEGAFDFDPVTAAIIGQATDRVNPGDVTTYNAALAYAEGALSLQGSVAYSTETSSYQNGLLQYRAGDRYTVALSAGYKWDDNWSTALSSYISGSQRNDLFNGVLNALEREAFNSNNLVYRIGIDHTWTDGVWSLGPTVSFLKRENNAYNPTTFQFIPAKTRWSAGLVAGHAPSQTISLNARVERIWTRELDLPNPFLVPTVTSDAWLFTAGAVVKF